MSCQVAVAKEFDKSVAKDINSFKNLGVKKVDKTKYGGGPCLFGDGKVPVPNATTAKSENIKVNMEDPSSLLKNPEGMAQAPSQPPKQLPMPPLLKKKDSNPMGALNNALSRAISQPGSRAVSRPDSPSRMFSLPPEAPFQNGTSDLLSLAAQDLESSLTGQSSTSTTVQNGHSMYQSSSAAHENHYHGNQASAAGNSKLSSVYHGIDTSAMSQIQQNTVAMQSTKSVQQSTWGFSGVSDFSEKQCHSPSGAFKPMSKSKSVSTLNMETSLEINDPKPMEVQKTASTFMPLEPSHQTHNSPIKVPKPVSPTSEGYKVLPKTAPPPVEARGSVLAPKKEAANSQQIGCKKADYSYYLDLINDGSEEVREEKCVTKPVHVKQPVQRTVSTNESISNSSVKSAKSMFENTNLSKQQSYSMTKSCSNLSKIGMSACTGGTVNNVSYKSHATQSSFNEPKLQETEAASSSTQLKVQSGHNLASLLAKDEIKSSMLVSTEEFDQEDVVIRESLVQNVKVATAKMNKMNKNDEKIITFERNIGGEQKNVQNAPKPSSLNKTPSFGGKTTTTATHQTKSVMQKGVQKGVQNGNVSYNTGNPEQILMSSMAALKPPSHISQVQHIHQSMNVHKNANGFASASVLEHQKKIELERQKQQEYEMSQRKIVFDKDAQRNLIPIQNEENELQMQLERRRVFAEQQKLQQEEEQRRKEAMVIQMQEEERRKTDLERQIILDLQRQEEQRRIAETERQRAIEMQKQEEIRRRAEAERQRVLQLQKQEEERKRAETERLRLLEIQRQEEERKRQEAERQQLLELQRQEEERRKAKEERQRMIEIKRQEEERIRLEAERAIQLQKKEEEKRRQEEQERLEEQRKQESKLRMLEEEQRKQFEAQQLKLHEAARQQQEMEIKRHKESQYQLEQQQRMYEMQSLQQRVGESVMSFDDEGERRQKLHEEQLRLLREKQEEEQKQLLLLHQQEEALWESKMNFIKKSSSSSVTESTQVSTVSHCCETSSRNSSSSTVPLKNTGEEAELHAPLLATQNTMKSSSEHCSSYSAENEVFQEMNAESATKMQNPVDPELIEYSAPIIHDGSRPSSTASSQKMTIHSRDNSITPITNPASPIQNLSTSGIATTTVSNNVDSFSQATKIDIVDDPLSFLLSDSPALVCSSAPSVCSSAPSAGSSSTSLAPNPSPIPSAPAPPPLQPSYTAIATGDAISELRARFNTTPVQQPFNDPVTPSPAALSTTHNPPSKMHSAPQNNTWNQKAVPQSPNLSTRAEVVSPNSQRKRVMAQCMSEAAGMTNGHMLPSQMKAAQRKSTKSRTERFIEAVCGEPQTVIRKTASGKEYLEVISPESTELARSLLEPPASR